MKIFNQKMTRSARLHKFNLMGVQAYVYEEDDGSYSAEFLNRVKFKCTKEEAIEYIESSFKKLNAALVELCS